MADRADSSTEALAPIPLPPEAPAAPPPLPAVARGADWREDLLFLFGSLVAVTISFVLTPDPRGHGTHEQLGLPPCVFHLVTRLPCPGCGLTTSVCWMSHGRPLAALRANALGPLVWALFVCQIPYRLALLVRPGWRLRWKLPSTRAINLTAIILLAVAWAANIALNGPSSR
jgi:hypothetical protein